MQKLFSPAAMMDGKAGVRTPRSARAWSKTALLPVERFSAVFHAAAGRGRTVVLDLWKKSPGDPDTEAFRFAARVGRDYPWLVIENCHRQLCARSAAAWKTAEKRSTGRTRSTPLRERISSSFNRRPVQRSAMASGGRAKTVSSTDSPSFLARKIKSWTSAPSRPVR